MQPHKKTEAATIKVQKILINIPFFKGSYLYNTHEKAFWTKTTPTKFNFFTKTAIFIIFTTN